MIRTRLSTALLMLATLSLAAEEPRWQPLPPLPDPEGFAGMFAGVSHGRLIVAGGANFPEQRPWEGGQKVWYNTVFGLDKPQGTWQVLGTLPQPLGYGVSITYQDRVICVGGSHAGGHVDDVFALEWRDDELVTTPLPRLPQPIANACGALVNDVIYIAGGQATADASTALSTFYALDLKHLEPGWKSLATWPGPGRILAVAASDQESFWLFSGAELYLSTATGKVQRRYLQDAYRYQPTVGWERLIDLLRPAVAAPSPAPAAKGKLWILGGDDGRQVDQDPLRHEGFSLAPLVYDIVARRWETAAPMAASRVTVPTTHWQQQWIIPSGEARPGVRSPQVWSWR